MLQHVDDRGRIVEGKIKGREEGQAGESAID